MTRQSWTEADDLYLRLGSRRLAATHPEAIALARQLGRTPTAVAAQIDSLHHAHSEPGVYPSTRWRYSELDRKVADR